MTARTITVDEWMAAEDSGLHMPRLEFALYLIRTGRLNEGVQDAPAPKPASSPLRVVAACCVALWTLWLFGEAS